MDFNSMLSSVSAHQSQWLNSLRTKSLASTSSSMTSLFSNENQRNKKKKTIHIYGSNTGEQTVSAVSSVTHISTSPDRVILQEKSPNRHIDSLSKPAPNVTHNKMLISSIIQPIPVALPAQPIIEVLRDEPQNICRNRHLLRNVPLDAENGILQRSNKTSKIPVYEIDSEEGVADSEEEIEYITSSQFGLHVKSISEPSQNTFEVTESVLMQDVDFITTESQYVPTDSQLSNPNFQAEDLTGSYGLEYNDEYYGLQPAITQTQDGLLISQTIAHEEESLNYREDNSEREILSDYVTSTVVLSDSAKISEVKDYSDFQKKESGFPMTITRVDELIEVKNVPEVLYLSEKNKDDEKVMSDQIIQTKETKSKDTIGTKTDIDVPARTLSVTFSYTKNPTSQQSDAHNVVEENTIVENSTNMPRQKDTSKRIETTMNQKQIHKRKATLADILSNTNQRGMYRRVGLSKRVKVDALHSNIKKK